MHCDVHHSVSYKRLSIANGAALTAAFDARDAISGKVRIPSAWTAADLAFFLAEDDNAWHVTDNQLPVAPTYALLRDKVGAAVKVTTIQTSEAGWYALPAEVLGCAKVKIQSTNTASTAAANQGADRELIVQLQT